MYRLHLFVLDSHLATLWESNCPFGFLRMMFPFGSRYFVFVFLSLWCLWWDNCIDSWSFPSLLFCFKLKLSPLHSKQYMYEETRSNRVSDFCDFVCSLFPKAILFDFYFIARKSHIFEIIDTAFRFSLFCVFVFHCWPLFLLLCNQICWCISRNASCMFDKCFRSTCCYHS